MGVGAGNWGEVVERFGFPRGKLAHSLWLQTGAELGFVGLVLLVLFYGVCMWRLLPLCRESARVPDPWVQHLARAVVAALCGFVVSAQFVSLNLLEHPYYITLIGAAMLKLMSEPHASGSVSSGRHAVHAEGYATPHEIGRGVLR
jgi:O-antigen ligase